MSSCRSYQQTIQEVEIKDLQQEIIRLKQRLSRMEGRKDLSPFAREFNGVQLRGKYAPMTDSKSFVPTKSLQPNDDNEGISNDQISSTHEDVFEGPPRQSSTPPLIESNFEEFEDPLLKSSSLPLYDEPVYDVYDDDMFFEVLDFDKPMYDDDQSKMDAPPELCMHIIPIKAANALAITEKGNALQNTSDVITNFRIVSIKHSCEELVNRMINHLSQERDAFRRKRWDMVLVNQYLCEVINEAKENILFRDVCWRMEAIVNCIFVCSRCKIDTGWKYLDWFS